MKDLAFIINQMLAEKKDIVYSILFGFIAGIAAVGLFAASGYLISKAAFAPPLYALTVTVAVVKLLGFVRALARYAERYFSHRATFTILGNLRVSFYEKLEPIAPRVFQRYRVGDLLSRVVGDVESLQDLFLRVLYPPIVLVIVFLSTIVFTSFYSIYVALLLLTGLFLTGFIIPTLVMVLRKRQVEHVREHRSVLSAEVAEFFQGFRDLKIYRKLETKEQNLEQLANAYVQEQKKEKKQAALSESLNTFVSMGISWAVLALGSYLVIGGQLEGILLAMLVMISLTVFENAAPMAVLPNYLEDNRRAATRLFSVVEGESQRQPEFYIESPFTTGKGPSVELKNVSFTYPGETRQTLIGLSLRLEAASKTAIVGPSGSGKSTLAELLLKFGTADHGEIQLNGEPIEQIKEEDIWDFTNVVLQENHYFYGTVKENLLMPDMVDTNEEKLADLLTLVGLEYIDLNDMVYEKGENLSGGEKQRLAMVRALLKDKPFWLLDEPTSSVDALTEKRIFDHLFHHMKGKTLILISHRLTGLEKMNQILVMDQGRIIESGSYEQLMNRKGYFYKMKQIEKNVFM
ncbi:thiol reductant ABC exporter subunit CydC [Sediminibacillus massiliensis]|uniref:thiol reductant ABC exporter subunit CydC n=1 Tax=Sediminibacillus massiliensis TaxID=1926277 RepID=UPI0009884E7F|nr:thiol reductant ABC exporter subunit CydC [Sediminibacillus massiliensis]